MEFEGFYFKLVAAVLSYSILTKTDWFDKYDEELSHLIDLKSEIENKTAALRQELMQKMELLGETTVCSKRFTINYFPQKTILKFDSDLFRLENEELYTNYCKPYQKKASIVVRKNKD